MHNRLHKFAALLSAALATSGCVQATRHSNTMIFGTNTSFGIKVGAGVNQVPTVLVGYDRQEAVIMPLVANTVDGNHRLPDGTYANRLGPCRLEQPVEVTGGGQGFPVHPCLLVATNAASTDSYSVLASFGAQFGAEATSAARAEGGLAQYFATGIAAQTLASTGGAALVNSRAPTTTPSGAAALGALFATPDQHQRGVQQAADYDVFEQRFANHLETLDDAAAVQFVAEFEQAAGFVILSGQNGLCSDKASCIQGVTSDVYFGRFGTTDLNAILDDLLN